MEFRILGMLEVCDAGRPVEIGAAKERALLAELVLHANQIVSRRAERNSSVVNRLRWRSPSVSMRMRGESTVKSKTWPPD